MTLQELLTQFRSETEDLFAALVNKFYFNHGTPYTDEGTTFAEEGIPYANETEVLDTIPVGMRYPYLTVNIAGVEFWFLPDGSLVNKMEYLVIADHSIELYKFINVATSTVFYRKTPNDGPPEVQTLATLKEDLGINNKVDKDGDKTLIDPALILKIHDKFAEDEAGVIQEILDYIANHVLTDNNFTDAYRAKLDLLNQDVFTINVPTGDVSERAAGATYGPGITGWTCAAAANPNDLEITHNLGRKFANVTVSYMDGTEQVLLMGSLGYTGVSAPSDDVLVIKGLSTKAFPLTIQIIFA